MPCGKNGKTVAKKMVKAKNYPNKEIFTLPNATGRIHRPKLIIGVIDNNIIMSKVGHRARMIGNDSYLAA